MIPQAEMRASLQGAWRLFRRDPAGIVLFNPTLTGYWRSYWAAILLAPSFIFLDLLVNDGKVPMDVRYGLVHLCAYIIDWTLFPVAMLSVADGMGKRALYLRYIAAYNWSAVIQMMFLFPTAMLALLLPGPVTLLAAQAVTILLLVYRAYVAQVGLQVGMGMAGAIVLLDVLLASVGKLATEFMLKG